MKKQRPGVMLYFSIRPSLKRLSLDEKGSLFEAILNYGQTGEIPDFNGMLGVAWDFIQPLVDADNEAYQNKCEQARKAISIRWANKNENTDVYDGIHPYTEDTNNNTITNSNTNTITKSIFNNDSCAEDLTGEHTKSMPKTEPISEAEFNQQRFKKIERLKQWADTKN